MKVLCVSIVVVVFFGLGYSQAQAQTRYCMKVTDEHGAVIPKAVIKLKPRKESSSQIKYKFMTDSDGRVEAAVHSGMYDLEIKAETFVKVVLKKQLLPPDSRDCMTIALKTKISPHQIT